MLFTEKLGNTEKPSREKLLGRQAYKERLPQREISTSFHKESSCSRLDSALSTLPWKLHLTQLSKYLGDFPSFLGWGQVLGRY